jgi:hypothetical protein
MEDKEEKYTHNIGMGRVIRWLYHFLIQISPKDNLNFRMVNADRVDVIGQEPLGELDYYIYRIGIIDPGGTGWYRYFF